MNKLEPAGLEAAKLAAACTQSDYFTLDAKLEAAILAYLNATRTDTVKATVKLLEWGEIRQVPDGPWSETMLRQRIGHHNLGPFAGSYSIQEMEAGGAWGWWNTWTAERYPDGVEPTEEAAMAAAQSDFEARILSSLEVPAHPEGVKAVEGERK